MSNNLIETRPIETYNNKLVEKIKLISFNNFKISIIGTASLKSQLYNADYDLLQEIEYINLKKAEEEIIKNFRLIIRRIAQNPNVYFIKFKLGYNEELYQKLNTVKEIKDFYKNKKEFLTKEEIEKINSISELDELKEYTTSLYRLRWKPKEIMEGYKIVNGKKKTIEDALSDGSVIKLDILAFLDGEFVDLNNVFEIYAGGKPLSIKDSNILTGLYEDIKYYYDEKNYVKMLKRIFSISKLNKDKKTIEKITEILNGNIGLSYQVYSNLDNLISLIESLTESKLKNLRDKINSHLQILKNRLGNIYEFNIPLSIFKEFDKIGNIKNFNSMKLRTEKLQNKLKEITNKEAIKVIKKFKLNYKKYLK